MSAPDLRSFGTDLLFAAATVADDKLPEVIANLARKGKIETLACIMSESMIDPDAHWNEHHHIRNEFAYSILPLMDAVSESLRPQALRFVSDWISWCKADSPKDMVGYITSGGATDIVLPLVRLGGSELDRDSRLTVYVRKLIEDEKPPEFTASIVEAAASVGHFDPLKIALSTLVWKYGHNDDAILISRLDKIDVPRLLEGERVGSVCENLIMRAGIIDKAGPWQAQNIANLWLTILEKIKVTPEEWQLLATEWSKSRAMFNVLCDAPEIADKAKRAISNIIATGIHPDAILADLPSKRDPAPILHRAIQSDNADLVKALIEAGADPLASIKYQGKQRKAQEFAPENSQTSHVLSAWRAKEAMSKVAAAARKAPT